MFNALWHSLPLWAQDGAIALALLAPALLQAPLILRGYRLGPLLRGLLRRHAGLSLVFILLIATSVAIGAAITAQERALRQGSARAADKFDLIVAAPGSEITAMLAAVYLQPSALPLIDGETFAEIAATEQVALAAPIAFGDSWQGAPIVGSTAEFVTHLAETLAEGRLFESTEEAVVGAGVPLEIGARFTPAHGHGVADAAEAHDVAYEVVGRMPRTGSPWDKALIVPVEAVWGVHGLADGHGPDWDGTLGPPFDPSRFPGTPAVLIRASSLWANYALQRAFTTERTMAFFPGNVLSRLHAIMGDLRQILSVVALLTQVLVTAAVLAGLMMLTRLLARRLALLRALGAPRRFIFALTWSFAGSLILAGTALGLLLGLIAARILSGMITARTDVLVTAHLGWPELHLVAGFVSLTLSLALIPAALTIRRPVIADLRL
ncbi:FtsX-like permease family protein [Poseidonocella sedimentorum]|uniref:Putative ABC transport system permease protein n=1 Tax=Poseidonocella sedimentorum TaxID=871652 RepID=A0A1I6DDP8_9RHOB|nr:FtsX-like permease family protein [Poseidonocella sedimentorum]SFR03573.1 putative ABC transport system permease protein [Poseidonocella sedimentorum]